MHELASGDSTESKHSTHNPKIEGLNPVTGTEREE
jgi:hypothetical protein